MAVRRLERLGPHHDLGRFDCGVADLNSWLTTHARSADAMDTTRTFVLLDDATSVGYFSLTMGSVRKETAPKKLVRGLPGYPVGMVLLTKLAVEQGRQGEALGGLLLAEALRRAARAGETVAARLVVVDAVDDRAAAFYLHHGFVRTPEHPLRLYRRMRDIRKSLDEAR